MDAYMFGLHNRDKEPTAQSLLSGLHDEDPEQLEVGRRTNGEKTFDACIECGDRIPPYSSYFCETHLIEFLQGAGEHPEEFSQSKEQFTISCSKQEKTYSL